MKVTLSPHICAYLDVLGGEALFERGEGEEMRGFVDLIFNLEQRLNNMNRGGQPVVKTFTDNVFAALPLREEDKYSIHDQVAYFLLEISRQIQQIMFLMELPIRGGITIGRLYIDERIVIGPAVASAVKLEKSAVHPRVLVDDTVLNAIQAKPIVQESLIYEASDGKRSLNYLGLMFGAYPEHKRIIDRAKRRNIGNENIRLKYEWLLQYHEDMRNRFSQLRG